MKKIVVSELRKCAALQCTQQEAAGFLGISPSLLSQKISNIPRLREVWDEGREMGKASLRRKQWNLATTSAPMAIHLGKHWLGQTDKQILEHQGPEGGPVKLDLSTLDATERSKLRQLLEKPTD